MLTCSEKARAEIRAALSKTGIALVVLEPTAGNKALALVKEQVFPFLKKLGSKTGSFGEHMATAEFKINKPSLLIEACKAIDEMHISAQNQDVQADLMNICSAASILPAPTANSARRATSFA